MKIKNLVKTLALTAGIAASFSSHAEFLDFQIDESQFGGGVVTADKLNGGYKEIITFDQEGNFTANAFVSLAQLFSNEGGDNLGSNSLIGASYAFNAVFTATGTVSVPGEDGSLASLTADSASFSLYLDRNRDTTSDDSDLSLTFNEDDVLLGGTGVIRENIALLYNFGGVYDFRFSDFELNEQGQALFVTPNPFYSKLIVDGDFDTITLNGEQKTTGDASVVFVPEPSTLAVLGLGLLGLGASSRRKAK